MPGASKTGVSLESQHAQETHRKETSDKNAAIPNKDKSFVISFDRLKITYEKIRNPLIAVIKWEHMNMHTETTRTMTPTGFYPSGWAITQTFYIQIPCKNGRFVILNHFLLKNISTVHQTPTLLCLNGSMKKDTPNIKTTMTTNDHHPALPADSPGYLTKVHAQDILPKLFAGMQFMKALKTKGETQVKRCSAVFLPLIPDP